MSPRPDPNIRSVFSSDEGALCPDCREAESRCRCEKKAEVLGDGRVRVRLDKKARRGKAVTIIEGLPLDADELKALAKELKKRCGSGGSVKDGAIELQGNVVQLMLEELAKRGYQAKKSGG